MAAFTYDPTTDLGRARFLLADTTPGGWFTDAEIQASLDYQGSVEGAVYECAINWLSHAARHTAARSESRQGAGRSKDDRHRVEAMERLVTRFERFAKTPMPTVSGFVSNIPSDDGWEDPT